MTGASTETMAPWEQAATSTLNLDRAEGSTEDLIARMQSKGEVPEPNGATVDTNTNGAFSPPIGANASCCNTTRKETIALKPTPSLESETGKQSPIEAQQGGANTVKKQVATANIKYKNQSGRAAILAASTAVHHDFGALTSILNVTLPLDAIADLSSDPNIEWVDSNGAVYFVQPYRY